MDPSFINTCVVPIIGVSCVVGKTAVAVTLVNPAPFPKKEPEKDPEIDTPVAPVVASILPDPLIAVVDKLEVPPPITTCPLVRLSTDRAAKFALLPDTIIFFQLAILYK